MEVTVSDDRRCCGPGVMAGWGLFYFFAIKFGVKEVNTLKLGMGGSLTLIMLSLTPPAVTTTIKVKEAS